MCADEPSWKGLTIIITRRRNWPRLSPMQQGSFCEHARPTRVERRKKGFRLRELRKLHCRIHCRSSLFRLRLIRSKLSHVCSRRIIQSRSCDAVRMADVTKEKMWFVFKGCDDCARATYLCSTHPTINVSSSPPSSPASRHVGRT